VLPDLGVAQVASAKADRDRRAGQRPPGQARVDRGIAVGLKLEGRGPGLISDMTDLDRRIEGLRFPGQLPRDAEGGNAGRRPLIGITSNDIAGQARLKATLSPGEQGLSRFDLESDEVRIGLPASLR
jgi:hypothetical protein